MKTTVIGNLFTNIKALTGEIAIVFAGSGSYQIKSEEIDACARVVTNAGNVFGMF